MMDIHSFSSLTAFWLGLLTSISPCPLATNITAVSYIGKRIGDSKSVLLSGLAYTVGRSIAYAALAAAVIAGMLSIPGLSHFLQKWMNRALGPSLILVSLFLFEWIRLPILTGRSETNETLHNLVEKTGIFGAGLLGFFFALSFCPLSAALFFGSLVPLSIKNQSVLLLPALYGIGTAVPAAMMAVILAKGGEWVGKAFNKMSKAERWARIGTGLVFLIVGISRMS